jgi:hypothetical protein
MPDNVGNVIAVTIFLLAYSLGTAAGQRRSLVALLLLILGLQAGSGLTTSTRSRASLVLGVIPLTAAVAE